jgi:hypothetical protein
MTVFKGYDQELLKVPELDEEIYVMVACHGSMSW